MAETYSPSIPKKNKVMPERKKSAIVIVGMPAIALPELKNIVEKNINKEYKIEINEIKKPQI